MSGAYHGRLFFHTCVNSILILFLKIWIFASPHVASLNCAVALPLKYRSNELASLDVIS